MTDRVKGNWKPRSDYKTLVDRHDPILVRNITKSGHPEPSCNMLVIYRDGHFYPVPGVPVFYGNNQCGWWTNDHFDEWMEFPE